MLKQEVTNKMIWYNTEIKKQSTKHLELKLTINSKKSTSFKLNPEHNS